MKLKDIISPALAVFVTTILAAVIMAVLPQLKRRLETTSESTPDRTATTPTVIVADTCIVTVQGVTYDVAKLRKIHSGGDIFLCGTDMTNTFKGQHGNDFKILAKYKI